MQETQATISEWCETTFGNAVSNTRIAHRAGEELQELIQALEDDERHPKAAEEIADVFIVLMRLASNLGADINGEIQRKMAVNRSRQWKLDGTGCGYHVPSPSPKD